MSDVELTAMLAEQFRQHMDDYLLRQVSSDGSELKLAIAYSGGLDSTALLHLAAHFCKQKKISLFAFHVHHGLSSNADAWLAHCQSQALLLNIPFSSRKITVGESPDGLEAAARKQRYTALADMATECGVKTILFAHHLDDQVETIFIRMLRGAGIDGAGGMRADAEFPMADRSGLRVFRPLLDVRRSLLESYVSQCGCEFVIDESNDDPKFFRNALRHQIMPVLESIRPGSLEACARSGRLLHAASDLLAEYVKAEFYSCKVGDALSRSALKDLSPLKRMQVFRFWLKSISVQMPSEVKLSEIVHQVVSVGHDQSVRFAIDTGFICIYRDTVYFQRDLQIKAENRAASCSFYWNSCREISFPEFGGKLVFEYSDYGIPESELLNYLLTLRWRHGGERMRIAGNRPSRSLKHLYQDAGIPVQARLQMPLLSFQDSILFAAGIGMNAEFCSRHVADSGARVIKITWIEN